MTKSKQLYGFHRPHDRRATAYTGELVNHVTGELYKPVSRVKQSFVAECDINNILKQYRNTGIIRHVSARAEQGSYQDLPDSVDFQTAMNTVILGEQAFASLPSKLRSRFGNDPTQFLGFLADPANYEEAKKLGLFNPPKKAPDPLHVIVQNPPEGGADAEQPKPAAGPPA